MEKKFDVLVFDVPVFDVNSYSSTNGSIRRHMISYEMLTNFPLAPMLAIFAVIFCYALYQRRQISVLQDNVNEIEKKFKDTESRLAWIEKLKHLEESGIVTDFCFILFFYIQ